MAKIIYNGDALKKWMGAPIGPTIPDYQVEIGNKIIDLLCEVLNTEMPISMILIAFGQILIDNGDHYHGSGIKVLAEVYKRMDPVTEYSDRNGE